jgi:16S rRNA (cytosine967-C5)-methyltransferase
MPSARDLAAGLLLEFETRGRLLREGLEAARDALSDERERALLTELAQGTLRRLGTLDAVLSSASRRPLAALDPVVRTALRLGLYQVVFLDRVPVHAAVDQAVGWVKRRLDAGAAGYANAVLRAVVRMQGGAARGPEQPRADVPREGGGAQRLLVPVFADPASDPLGNLSERFSCPRWLVERWHERLGRERTMLVLRAGIERPVVALRARGPRAEALARWLKERDVPFVAGPVAGSLLLDGAGGAVAEAVAAGLARVQDATSQRVAPLLDPREGGRYLDLCAAPGGKTLHLADLLVHGAVTACDVDPKRLERLEALRPLMGEVEYACRRVPSEGALPFAAGAFDGVLVDAPCSNTGVLRRRVEARWRLAPDDIGTLARLQRDLLERAWPLVAPGGRLVYATCSIEAEEDEDVVASFVADRPEARAEVAFRVLPGREADGGFAAVLHRAT